MKSRDKAEVSTRLTAIGIIPVVRAESTEMGRRAVAAILKGGISVLEITMTVPGAVRMIEELSAEVDAEVIIGAGTVLDAQTARACIDAGAQFIVSPALDLGTIALCGQQGILVMPGVLTPTEVVTAWTAGADFVKIFPAGAVGGASYLKALKAPLPQVKMVPTGGVSLQNAATFIKAGAEALGVGGELVDTKALREGRDDLITERARLFVDIVQQARAK
jgi:2-dehydro-3-deoxyphosphogluconate aldolase / (4S)-4-hydroxy-2-oxoglutarate aldolase